MLRRGNRVAIVSLAPEEWTSSKCGLHQPCVGEGLHKFLRRGRRILRSQRKGGDKGCWLRGRCWAAPTRVPRQAARTIGPDWARDVIRPLSRWLAVRPGLWRLCSCSSRCLCRLALARRTRQKSNNRCLAEGDNYHYILTSSIHDRFENPSDFNNSAGKSNADFWDTWNYGGTTFYVDGWWQDEVSGGGQL